MNNAIEITMTSQEIMDAATLAFSQFEATAKHYYIDGCEGYYRAYENMRGPLAPLAGQSVEEEVDAAYNKYLAALKFVIG
jgi:hypothetical protein